MEARALLQEQAPREHLARSVHRDVKVDDQLAVHQPEVALPQGGLATTRELGVAADPTAREARIHQALEGHDAPRDRSRTPRGVAGQDREAQETMTGIATDLTRGGPECALNSSTGRSARRRPRGPPQGPPEGFDS
jgi:hypothetical protein